jgi:hypothetical protein
MNGTKTIFELRLKTAPIAWNDIADVVLQELALSPTCRVKAIIEADS